MIKKIISGGQTGADRAALDWAIWRGIPHGGWCPKGRKAEDGPIPARYKLVEMESEDYPARTERNVKHSDGTVIISISEELSRGSALTQRLAEEHWKPCVHIHSALPNSGALLRAFVEIAEIKTLNVAGPRLSSEPGIADFVRTTLSEHDDRYFTAPLTKFREVTDMERPPVVASASESVEWLPASITIAVAITSACAAFLKSISPMVVQWLKGREDRTLKINLHGMEFEIRGYQDTRRIINKIESLCAMMPPKVSASAKKTAAHSTKDKGKKGQ